MILFVTTITEICTALHIASELAQVPAELLVKVGNVNKLNEVQCIN